MDVIACFATGINNCVRHPATSDPLCLSVSHLLLSHNTYLQHSSNAGSRNSYWVNPQP